MTTAALTALRVSNSLAGRLAPKATARRVGRTFTTPKTRPLRPWEVKVEESAERITLSAGLSALHWSGSGSRVLALHGWEGRATQYGALAERLRAVDADVVALDGPAHGRSPGARANPVAFARSLLDADRELGPFDVVVGHSMGGAAAALAIAWGLRVRGAVLIASPASLLGVLQRFAGFVGLPQRAASNFVRELEAQAGVPAAEVDIAGLAQRVSVPVLIIHDRNDDNVPADEGRTMAAALPRATFVETTGLGHNRVMRAPEVLDAIVGFIGREGAQPAQ